MIRSQWMHSSKKAGKIHFDSFVEDSGRVWAHNASDGLVPWTALLPLRSAELRSPAAASSPSAKLAGTTHRFYTGRARRLDGAAGFFTAIDIGTTFGECKSQFQ